MLQVVEGHRVLIQMDNQLLNLVVIILVQLIAKAIMGLLQLVQCNVVEGHRQYLGLLHNLLYTEELHVQFKV